MSSEGKGIKGTPSLLKSGEIVIFSQPLVTIQSTNYNDLLNNEINKSKDKFDLFPDNLHLRKDGPKIRNKPMVMR